MAVLVPRQAESAAALRRRGVAAYLAIAFGLAWAPFLPVVFGGRPTGLALMTVAPALACVVVRRWVTREGFEGLGLRPRPSALIRGWPVLVIALGWPFVTAPLTALLAGHARDAALADGMAWVALSVAVAPLILGEELGWRGYLQLRLCPGRPVLAAVVTGLVWGVWHYPVLLTSGARDVTVLLAFTAGCVTVSVFLGWLRELSASVWTSAAGHASNNVTEDNLVRSVFDGPATGAETVDVLLAEAVVLLGVVVVGRRHSPSR